MVHFYKLFFTVSFLFLAILIESQTIPASNIRAAGSPCSMCVPDNWVLVGGTPDMSNQSQAASTTNGNTYGADATWVPAGSTPTQNPTVAQITTLPLPPNGHTDWITLRDLGPQLTEEVVSATMGNLVAGYTYEVTLYTLTARTNFDGGISKTNTYSERYNNNFRYKLGNGGFIVIPTITQDIWGTTKIRFTASGTSETLQLLPGFDAPGNLVFESVQISVSENAIVVLPVAKNDIFYIGSESLLTGNIFNNNGNGVDQEGAGNATVTAYDTVSGNGGTVVVNPDGTFSYRSAVNFVGIDTFTYTITDSNGVSSTATVTITVFKDPDGDNVNYEIDIDNDNDGILDVNEGGPGNLNYEFYNISPAGDTVNNIPKTGATGTGLVSNFNVGALAQLVTPGDLDTFSIRYTGSIYINRKANYTFYTSSDDGSKIYIDGMVNPVVNNDGAHGTQEQSGSVLLEAGQHSIRIEFFERDGGESLEVRYESAELQIPKSAIPFKLFSPANARDTDGDLIPDYLDLDSDADGCPDAAEGGETFPSSSLVTAPSYVRPQSVNQNLGNNVDANGVPIIAGAAGQSIGTSINPAIGCICYNPAITTEPGVETQHGITLLKRAGADDGNWPMLRTSAHTVLESNVKGFVITRMTTQQILDITNPVEGMMVYDTDVMCLKLNSNGLNTGWSCFTTPACPL